MSSRISVEPALADLTAPAKRSAPAITDGAAPPGQYSDRAWALQLGLLLATLVWALGWYWDSAASMAAIWWRSETFAHGLVVYPISAWLIWRKRAELRAVRCTPSYLGVLFVGIAAFAWLLGDLGGVQAAQHLGFVSIVAAMVWAVLGTSLARAIAFPLAFTFLGVPIGEFMLPMLIEHTADFTVGALRLTGIPVYREGNDFVLPTGSWSVVEACSGLRYLIASLTLGLLYAYLSYTSLRRRILFVLASIVVPIVANWVRAYMIVMIGHLSGMKYAVGVDHLLYGWVFFGVVMLLLFWLGSIWSEEEVKPEPAAVPLTRSPPTIQPGLVVGALLAAAVASAAPAYSDFLDSRSLGDGVAQIAAPAAAHGWEPRPVEEALFRPHYAGATSLFEQSFQKDDRVVGLYIAYYANQRQGRELISFGNGIWSSSDHDWRLVGQKRLTGLSVPPEAIQTRLRSPEAETTVWHWYWAGGRWVTRPELVKALQAFDRLLGKGDDGAVIVAYARATSDSKRVEAALEQFSSDMAPSIEQALSEARSQRHAQLAAARASSR